MNNPSLAS